MDEMNTAKRSRVEIIETATCWLVSDGTSHETAPVALAHVRRASADRATAAGHDVTIVEWQPTTRIGRMVVRALVTA